MSCVAGTPGRCSWSRSASASSGKRQFAGRVCVREWSSRMEPRSGFRITGQLVLGVSIAVLGVLFTLDNLHILRAREVLRFWPVALIAIGLVHVSQARSAAGTVGGGVWILVGVVLLGGRLGLFHANIFSLWPLILVLV